MNLQIAFCTFWAEHEIQALHEEKDSLLNLLLKAAIRLKYVLFDLHFFFNFVMATGPNLHSCIFVSSAFLGTCPLCFVYIHLLEVDSSCVLENLHFLFLGAFCGLVFIPPLWSVQDLTPLEGMRCFAAQRVIVINILFIHPDDDKWGADLHKLYYRTGRNSIESIEACHTGFINVEIIPSKLVCQSDCLTDGYKLPIIWTYKQSKLHSAPPTSQWIPGPVLRVSLQLKWGTETKLSPKQAVLTFQWGEFMCPGVWRHKFPVELTQKFEISFAAFLLLWNSLSPPPSKIKLSATSLNVTRSMENRVSTASLEISSQLLSAWNERRSGWKEYNLKVLCSFCLTTENLKNKFSVEKLFHLKLSLMFPTVCWKRCLRNNNVPRRENLPWAICFQCHTCN